MLASRFMATVSETASIPLTVDHPTAVVFLDETGVIERRDDPFFGIGCLKIRDHGDLARELRMLRDRFDYRHELHWSNFDKAALQHRDDVVQMACAAIDLAFDSDGTTFRCLISNRAHGDLTTPFKKHRYAAHKAYESFATRALNSIIDGTEIVTVLADQQSTPPAIRFEADVQNAVNAAKRRLAVASLCRLDSRCHDGLQLIDIMLGAAALDLRQGLDPESEAQKQQLLGHLLDRCGCNSFRPSGRRSADGTWEVQILTKPKRSRRGRRGR